MKNTLLIVWNIVLTVAIAFLLFHVLSEEVEKQKSTTTQKPAMPSDSASAFRVAYVNIDSLENHYELFAKKKKELEGKKQQSETQFNKKMADFQNDYTAAQQSAATMTESQLQATQDKLQKQEAYLQKLQNDLQSDFQDQIEKFNTEVKDSLDSFMKTYNADKRFAYILSYTDGGDILFAQPEYDITADAIKGMNERLKKKGSK
ncbi:MAG TPA: OmpH family outer membrane protein [Chitinophagales bacterium]|nr:OmpH family outer membrane protein [Chitinophagales bacterium]